MLGRLGCEMRSKRAWRAGAGGREKERERAGPVPRACRRRCASCRRYHRSRSRPLQQDTENFDSYKDLHSLLEDMASALALTPDGLLKADWFIQVSVPA